MIASICLSLSPYPQRFPRFHPFANPCLSSLEFLACTYLAVGKSVLPLNPRAGPWPEQHCFTHLYPLSNLDHKGREFAAPSFWRGWISGGGRGGKPGSLLPWVGCSSPTIWLRIVRRDDDLILSRLRVFLPEDGLVPALSDEGALGSGWEGEECRCGFWLL